MDYAGNLYVANSGNNTITVYNNGLLGNGTPSRTLAGAATLLGAPTGVAVDVAGYLYVLNASPGSITVYSPGATGNAAPVRSITNVAAGFGQQIAVDPFQNVYVNIGGYNVWGPTASGPVSPNVIVNALGGGGIAISPTQP